MSCAVALAHDEGVVHRDEQRHERARQAGHRDAGAAAQHAQDVRARERRPRDARLQACTCMCKASCVPLCSRAAPFVPPLQQPFKPAAWIVSCANGGAWAKAVVAASGGCRTYEHA